ncbi:putative u-box domain-containing protein 55 [Quercus suber]|uniref:U-box domain-containing protein 55 n=1 Tax=Quercus suber TaxID=58331 RepID=A0AAW0M210_QUESU
MRNIEAIPASGHENLEEEMVIYVAVGIDVKECLSILLWALHNCGGKRICIIHLELYDPQYTMLIIN